MKIKKTAIRIYKSINQITNRFLRDNIKEYSAYSALFIVLSFIPFLTIVLTVIKNVDFLTQPEFYDFEIISKDVSVFLKQLLAEINEKSNGAILSITTIVALWSAARGLIGIINGLNRIHHEKETRGFIRLRISAVFYMIVLIAVMLITLALLVFGASILERLTAVFPYLEGINSTAFSLRWIIGFGILVLFFLLVYTALPIDKGKPFTKLPGAVFSALGWLIFSALYSYYIDNFANYSYIYGSLTVIVLLILWLYVCMYILFIGEELNVMLRDGYIQRLAKFVVTPLKKEKKK